MPDFFYPDKPIDLSNFPPQTDEQKQALQDFFGGTANPQKTVGKVDQVAEALKKDGFKKMVMYGLCWGRCNCVWAYCGILQTNWSCRYV